MFDRFNRSINYLRISVTDRCNLRCVYCMPPSGVFSLPHAEILTYEELLVCIRVAVRLGVDKIRITGGEPLVRKGLLPFIQSVSAVPGIRDLCMTSNGALLKKFALPLKQAGLQRINISLDTLRSDRYRQITRGGQLDEVLAGVKSAELAGLSPVKINVVMLRDFNFDEINDFARMSIDSPFEIRFIEFMPFETSTITARERFVSSREVLDIIGGNFPLEQSPRASGVSSPARQYKIAGARGRIGLISPLTDHFCHLCNRLRITPDGKLRTCLLSDSMVDVKAVLRGGGAEEEVADLFRRSVSVKPERHELTLSEWKKCSSTMSRIGG